MYKIDSVNPETSVNPGLSLHSLGTLCIFAGQHVHPWLNYTRRLGGYADKGW